MISRSNYVAITLIMCVILLMFQLTGVSENVLMNSGENLYSEDAVTDQQISLQRQQYRNVVSALETEDGESADVGLVGDPDEKCLLVGKEWCIAQKKSYCCYSSLTEAADDKAGASFLIINGETLGSEEDIDALRMLAEQGRNVVVSSLPDLEELAKSADLKRCLGIADTGEDIIETDGIKLFAGLLLGGETVYEDYEQALPYIILDDSVTAYAVAQSDEEWIQGLDNEELPAVMWRYSPDVGEIYVVNGSYLEEQIGAGILTGFAADAEEIYLYPVVNAQVSVVENYPVIADENGEIMEEEYGQGSSIVSRDIMWPSIVAVYYDTGDVMTVTSSLRLDYSQDGEIDTSLLTYYYEQITKEKGEIGISAYQVSDLSLQDKLEADLKIYDEVLPNYEIKVFQSGNLDDEEYESFVGEGGMLSDVKTVLTDYTQKSQESFFSYLNDEVLKLPIYMDSSVMEAEDDFRARSMMTAYGYYGTALDTSKVIYPETDEDYWNIMSNEWSKNYRPYRVPFENFERLTATEADRRVRNYLALEYEMETKDDIVQIEVNSMEEKSYFILRLHGEEIKEMTGGSYEKIEDGWYLLTIDGSSAQIGVQQTNVCKYYIE